MPARRSPFRPTAGSRLGLRLLALTTPAVLVAGAVSACSDTSTGDRAQPVASGTTAAGAGTPTASGTPAATANAGATASGGATAKSTGATGSAQVAACALADVKPTVIAQPQRTSGTTRMAIVELTNVSTRSCRLDGWATVALLNAAGDVVVVPSSNVQEPGAPVPVDLAPGTSASAGIKWVVCDKAGADCPTGNTLMVGLPNGSGAKDAELTDFAAAEKSDLTMKQLQIGSLQPSAQGVVAW